MLMGNTFILIGILTVSGALCAVPKKTKRLVQSNGYVKLWKKDRRAGYYFGHILHIYELYRKNENNATLVIRYSVYHCNFSLYINCDTIQ